MSRRISLLFLGGVRKEKLCNIPAVAGNCSALVFKTVDVPDDLATARLKPQM